MKKKVEMIVEICDVCGSKDVWLYKCVKCGIEFCGDCLDKSGVRYAQEMNIMSTSDGIYCKTCDDALSKSKTDKLHNAFVKLVLLKEESETFYTDWSKRRKLAEKEIERWINK